MAAAVYEASDAASIPGDLKNRRPDAGRLYDASQMILRVEPRGAKTLTGWRREVDDDCVAVKRMFTYTSHIVYCTYAGDFVGCGDTECSKCRARISS